MDEETLTMQPEDDESASSDVAPDAGDDERAEKGVSSDLIRGHINTIILRSLYDGDKYGYEIIAEIERKSSGQYSLKQPSLYSALKRLEKDGYITSYWGGSVGGGRRKYFSLTDEGKAVSEQNQAEWEYSRTIIDSLISDRDFDFNRPAPTAVDMSVLRRSTSRVPPRDGEGEEELDFEPSFDDSALRERLEEDAKRKQDELDASYNEKLKALEDEYAEKFASLDRERADFESEKARLEEEMLAREKALNDSYESNLRQLALIREQQEALLLSRREELEREIAEEREQLLAEKQENAEAQAAADESLKNELELQKQKNLEESEEHARAIRALEEANEQALTEQRESSDAALKAEKESHESELKELSEKHRREMETMQDNARREKEEAVRLARENEADLQETRLQNEQKRYNELLNEERMRFNDALTDEAKRHEAQIKEDRARYEQALADQLDAQRRQMELEMAEREKQIIHRNYISLVEPSNQQVQPAYAQQSVSEETQSGADYRNVVGRLYENTVRPSSRSSEDSAATPVNGIDFRDIQKRASRDGLRVETVGGESPAATESSDGGDTVVHKGKALFLSAIVAFFWCVIIGGITMGLESTLTLPVFFPYLMWCIGLVLLLVTGLLYANHFGEGTLRKSSIAFINAIVVYALIVIVSLIVALSVRIDFENISELMTFVILPAIYFVGVLIFGICYFLQVRPKK